MISTNAPSISFPVVPILMKMKADEDCDHTRDEKENECEKAADGEEAPSAIHNNERGEDFQVRLRVYIEAIFGLQ